jgi:hypothetical protein
VKLFCRCARPSPIAAAPWLLLPRHGRGAPPCLPRFCCELVPGAGFPPCIARLLPQARALPVVAPGSPLCRTPLHQLAPSLAKQVAMPSRVYPCVQPWVSLRSVPAPRPVSCSPDRVCVVDLRSSCSAIGSAYLDLLIVMDSVSTSHHNSPS